MGKGAFKRISYAKSRKKPNLVSGERKFCLEYDGTCWIGESLYNVDQNEGCLPRRIEQVPKSSILVNKMRGIAHEGIPIYTNISFSKKKFHYL